MDLSTITLTDQSLEDLTAFRRRLDKEIRLREIEKARIARKALRETAKEHGFNINDLIKPSRPEQRSQRTIRFRHPDDPSKVWGGRGRKPVWVREWQDAGGSLDDLRVSPDS